ncbi:menaquinone-dependent protoporphyrinogen IX dehydrogenase [Vibrio sp. YMD68]|uniref:menaquinone-dependent protoporphyrinogen IX dehydrogenase n=1 Tax=Vibrio sp. YMD68 TaxID=3042300 RepID=UPI00249C849A|nr:menaquinone-dependent protoporphyrinogen IX dehydrogenase [Vibrio sp. YMD68]WGW00357.1 menaquinone-dependent protoporphyrinogen IX dehydrogenase [Vibrio sp. YMD68]
MKALFLYSSQDGQTKKIIHYIQQELDLNECDVIDIHQADTVELGKYERVLIGASIRYGHLNKKLYQFIQNHQSSLESGKSAFFCVNLTARKEEQGKDTPEGSVYIKTFLNKSPWKPKLIGVFAGALYYPRYKWIDKVMIRFIMKLTGGETDTSKEVEYTNWSKVTLFAKQFNDM